ncbi:uncharacterized protein LOC109538862 isoform X3 [Dendroctonus ponderosae]|uniref:PiggyBac transposable element-derived protein domain-containing protein n=1 Tax=Dendroctonus ponderosae TaxID=77166 RepID=A0AAR5PM42_DENPD|nr:uncharacterized protein LOC109538862 isoform X3 [Dendroctonus ponderosae]
MTNPVPLEQYQGDPGESESSSSESPEPMDQDENTGGGQRQAVSPINSAGSDKSEIFEPDDQPEYFEVWSSDATSEDEEEEELEQKSARPKRVDEWSETMSKDRITTLTYNGIPGIQLLDTERKYTVLECFKLFVDDALIKLMVIETNKHARSKFVRYGYHEGFLSGWLDVDFKEMSQFLGLLIFMGFKRFPETSCYWSTERMYRMSVACRIFTQTRFHRILAFWHFGTEGSDTVLAKINPLISRLNTNYRKYKEPDQILYVGRSTVCLRNKYIFEPSLGAVKKGSKILKVIDQDGYTYKTKILKTGAGRREQTMADVLQVLDGFLNQGRLIIFHNLWIGLDLAEKLLSCKCHSIGMIRKNSRGASKELLSRSIQDGDLVGVQNPQGISIMKWQLSGVEYFGISTCHSLETPPQKKPAKSQSESTTNPEESQVPTFLRDIALSESIFDMHEKFNVNTSPVNEQVKWYQRFAYDAIVNTATVNALVLYKALNNETIKMWDFRDKLFRELVDIKQLPSVSSDDEAEEPDLED